MHRIGSPPRSLPPQPKTQESKTSPLGEQAAGHPVNTPGSDGDEAGAPAHELTSDQIEMRYQRTLTSLEEQYKSQERACSTILDRLGIGRNLDEKKKNALFEKIIDQGSFEATVKIIGKLLKVDRGAFSADQTRELTNLGIFMGVRDEVGKQLQPFVTARDLRDSGMEPSAYPTQWYSDLMDSHSRKLPTQPKPATAAEAVPTRPRSGNNMPGSLATSPAEEQPSPEEVAAKALIASGLIPEGDQQAAVALALASGTPVSQSITPQQEADLKGLGLL